MAEEFYVLMREEESGDETGTAGAVVACCDNKNNIKVLKTVLVTKIAGEEVYLVSGGASGGGCTGREREYKGNGGVG